MAVDAAEGETQFAKSRRAEAGNGELAAGAQNPPGFVQRLAEVAPLDGETGPVEINAVIGQRQVFEVATQIQCALWGAFEHGRREVEPQHFGQGELMFEQGEAIAGAAAGIKQALWRLAW